MRVDGPKERTPLASLGDCLAAAGVFVTVHDGSGEVLASNLGAALSGGQACGLNPHASLTTAEGVALPPHQRPEQRAIATGQPARDLLVGLRREGRDDVLRLRVDALPCSEPPHNRVRRVVCMWRVEAGTVEPTAAATPRGARGAAADEPFAEIDGDSTAITALKDDMRKVAHDADVTVLILGESGTGKERVARAIHRASRRAAAPFVVVNCAGLSPTLVEDELFGHVRGAFTGAVDDRAGPFERADGGTVFLDEIGELTAELQMKLLRALQERTVQRLGGRRDVAFDVRVIAATHVDLARAMARGRFREDLYYRLSVYELRVPPLRRRSAGDLRVIVDTILTRLAARKGRPVPILDAAVIERLVAYAWPGNVRELENTLERMMVAGGGTVLTEAHLPVGFGRRSASMRVSEGDDGPLRASGSGDDARGSPSRADAVAALQRSGFRRGRAAAMLGLSRHQLYRLLKREAVEDLSPE